MKALVAIKRVVDANVRVRLKADGSDVDTAGLKMSLNPFDENAVEEAVRLKERGKLTEIVAVAVGAGQSQDVLRQALAMGADRALLVEAGEEYDALGVAKLLKAVVEREAPSLVMLGKQAIDDDAAEVPQMLAALLGAPQATFASEIEIGEKLKVTREIDGGRETVELTLPAVVSADLRLNEPRFVKLPNIMMAKKKPIETLKAAELGVAPRQKVRRLSVAEPKGRSGGTRLSSVAELVDRLRNQAKVL